MNSSQNGGAKDTWGSREPPAAHRGLHVGGPLPRGRRSDRARRAPAPRAGGGRDLCRGGGAGRAACRSSSRPVAVEMIDPLLARLDGLCISGGPDLDPSFYGAEPHPELGPTFPDIDRFELAILRHAQARGLPVLAICRGMQLLNVSRGGTLCQHLPDRVDGSVVHRQTRPGRFATHEVRVERASRLRGLLGSERLDVNSFHHQAVRAGRDRAARGRLVAGRRHRGRRDRWTALRARRAVARRVARRRHAARRALRRARARGDRAPRARRRPVASPAADVRTLGT